MAEDGREEISATLFPGSWRGIPIYFDGGSISGGHKVTPKPIFNSSEQDVADVGLRQRGYSVEGFVAARYMKQLPSNETGISSDYHEQRSAILDALDQSGVGVLVHPFEGEIRDLIVSSWSLNETISEAGMGKLSIEFIRKTVGAVPKEQRGSSGEVSKLATDVDLTFLELVEFAWGVDLSFVKGIEEAIAKVQDVYDKVQSVVATVESVSAEINGFASTISELTSDLASIITSPLSVVASIRNAFIAIDNIFPTLEGKFTALKHGFDYGLGDKDFNTFTAAGKQRKANQDALNTAVQGMFLTRAYVAATGLDLSTLDRIEEVEKILGDQHDLMVENTVTSPEARVALGVIRTAFFNFLADAKVTALKVTDEPVPPLTPRVLSYLFYGDDDLDDVMKQINAVESYGLISGTAKVLSS